jgi:hypothetical protein
MHVDHLIELLFCHLPHGRVTGDSRIVDHDVDRPERRDGSVHQGLYVGGGRDIATNADSRGWQSFRGFLGLRLVEVTDDDVGTVIREHRGDRQTDALSAAGNDGRTT